MTDAAGVAAIICQGSCNRRYRKAEAAYQAAEAAFKAALLEYDNAMIAGLRPPPLPQPPEKHDVTPYAGDPVWCPRDQSLIRTALDELDDLACRVSRESNGMRAPAAAPRVSGTRGHKSPSSLGDLLDALEVDLREWEGAVRKRDTRVRRGELSTSLTASVDWLWAHFNVIIVSPDFGLPFGQEIRQWHRILKHVGHAGSVRHTKPLPCPRETCQRFGSLVEEEGNDYIECMACHKLMSRDEYDYYESSYPKRRNQAADALSASV